MDVRVGCGLVHPVPATGAADGRVVHAVGDHGGAAVMDALRELGGEAHHVGHGGRVLAEQVVNLTCREEGERGGGEGAENCENAARKGIEWEGCWEVKPTG